MMWALIFMSSARVSIPEYVEVYQTRQECVSKIKHRGVFSFPVNYCSPIVNTPTK